MALKIYNTLSHRKEKFEPVKPGEARIYCCGPTVYDSFHIGHARSVVAFDLLRRYLEYSGYRVSFVTNFTDIDDKIIARARDEGRSWKELTLHYIREFFLLMDALGVKRATVYPKCSEYIPRMVKFISELLESGHAYAAGGDVYFHVPSFSGYGQLSGRKVDRQLAGASGRTGEEADRKRHPADFALWKAAKAGEPSWDSPWGKGRPGWHIECSVMSLHTVGSEFDIHCGGKDLIFPHHENEIAQSRAHGDRFARYWMHNGFVGFDFRGLPEKTVEKIHAEQPEAIDDKGNIKLGKSLWKYLEPLGLAQWLKDMLRPRGKYDPMTVRMALISTHYRSPINFSPALLHEAVGRYERLLNALEAASEVLDEPVGKPEIGAEAAGALLDVVNEVEAGFREAMDDDLNSAKALGRLFEMAGAINSMCAARRDAGKTGMDGQLGSAAREALARAGASLAEKMEVLGLRSSRTETGGGETSGDELLELLLETRAKVRKAGRFDLSDMIRDRLMDLGWKIEDLPGEKWKVKRDD